MKLFRKGSSTTSESNCSTSKDSSQNHLDVMENRNDDDSIAIEFISREGERMVSTENDVKRRRRKGDKRNRNRRRRQTALNPKRLLCFLKTNLDIEDNQHEMHGNAMSLPKSHRYVVEYDYEHAGLSPDKRQGGNSSRDEFCDHFFSRDLKREERPIILTVENAQVLAALSRDESTAACTYAPLREFKEEKKGKERKYQDREREFQKEREHFYQENPKQFQRRQHSPNDGLSSIRPSIQSENDLKKATTTDRNGKKRGNNPTDSMISSVTSSSHRAAGNDPSAVPSVGLSAATSEDPPVILSPYAHVSPRRKNLRSISNHDMKMYSQRDRSSAHSNLGTIAERYNEFDDASSSSSSFCWTSSYYSDSSSLDSDSESDSDSDYYNESESDGSESDRDNESDSENDELSVIYAHARVASLIKKKRYGEEEKSTVGAANEDCATGPVDGYWKKLLNEAE